MCKMCKMCTMRAGLQVVQVDRVRVCDPGTKASPKEHDTLGHNVW
jgi:hypothetical protein